MPTRGRKGMARRVYREGQSVPVVINGQVLARSRSPTSCLRGPGTEGRGQRGVSDQRPSRLPTLMEDTPGGTGPDEPPDQHQDIDLDFDHHGEPIRISMPCPPTRSASRRIRWRGPFGQIGPGLILAASIVGTGELINTTGLGAGPASACSG